MQSLFLVMLLAAAATAAVVSNEVLEVMEVPEMVEEDEVADVDVNEMPVVIVTDENGLTDETELTDEDETEVANRRNLSVGSIGSSDRLAYNNTMTVNAGQYQMRERLYRTSRPISAIRVTRIGASPNAFPSLVNGGLGQTFVTIRIRSAAGRGFNYRILVYVR